MVIRGDPRQQIILLLLAIVCSSARPAWAIINPKFTPVELVRAASQIVLIEFSPPQGNASIGRIAQTLKGPADAQAAIKLQWQGQDEVTTEEVSAAFHGEKSATAILFASRRASEGVIQIGTHWFAANKQQDAWVLKPDTEDRFSVWAGSAAMLARAGQYALADPKASFPVRSEMTWGSDLHLGQASGRVSGCLSVDFGEPLGACAVVLSEESDQLFSTRGGKVVNVTDRARLRSASRVAAAGDFNRDGSMDLALWDGKGLKVAFQTDGVFELRAVEAELRDCLSLGCIDVGVERSGVLAGTSEGPALLIPAGVGKYDARPLARNGSQADAGALCIAADLDSDGRCDLVELAQRRMVIHPAEAPGRFGPPQRIALELVRDPRVALCGDYDADGQLDLLVAGSDGLALLCRDEKRQWRVITHITGELDYHGNANQPRIVAAWPCDINGDGRQGMALLHPNRKPMLFFNRGFACFGLARELELSNVGTATDNADPFAQATESRSKAAEAIQHGQSAGAMLDLNGDGVTDLLAVDLKGEIWALLGKRDPRPPILTIAPSARSSGPVTVTVMAKNRCQGMYVIRPGMPVTLGSAQPGPLTLKWTALDGRPRVRELDFTRDTRVELTP